MSVQLSKLCQWILLISLSGWLLACQPTAAPTDESPLIAELIVTDTPVIEDTEAPLPSATVPSPTVTPRATATAALPPPTITPIPTATDSSVSTGITDITIEPPTTTPTPSATPEPEPALNGVPLTEFIVFPDSSVERMREVFAEGQARGRNGRAFSKIGDSVIVNADFLTRFDQPDQFDLGPYDSLQPVIDHYAGSFIRFGVGMRVSLRAWGVFDPMWADKEWCEPNEVMIDCEFRLNNPSIVLIHLGTNDDGSTFETFMRKVIETSIAEGVIPVILTKADRFEGDDNRNNNAMRQIAVDYQVPLLDFDIVAATLPNRGLQEDNIHLNGPLQHDYNLDEVYEKGHTVHNLTVLMMLEAILSQVVNAENS